MNFVLNRNKTVSSTLGHTIVFVKGEPTHVPPAMWAEVQAIGAIPQEEIPEEPTPTNPEPADPVARKKLILDAFEKIILKGQRDSFAASGAPHAKALTAALGFSIHNKERDALWREFQADTVE